MQNTLSEGLGHPGASVPVAVDEALFPGLRTVLRRWKGREGVVGSASSTAGWLQLPGLLLSRGNLYEWEVTLFSRLYPELRIVSLHIRFPWAAALPRRAGAGVSEVESW